MTATTEVSVLIVGGGGAGLTASILLAQLGVDALLISALPTTSTLPKAHMLNQRTMEILRDAGVAEAIRERATPLDNMQASAWYVGLAGDRPGAGRRIGRIEGWGAGYTDTSYIDASPCPPANLPQIRLEPVLKDRADKLAPGRVRFHHELIDIAPDEDGVSATILDRDSQTEYRVRARYVLACDGGRTIGKELGVEWQGPRHISNQVSIHMSADLSQLIGDPDVLMRWIWTEDGVMGCLVPMGPERWGPDSEEWVYHQTYLSNDARGLSDESVLADMRRTLGLDDVPLDIHKISRWSLEGVVATRFQIGRVFFLGDAAHRCPPAGGLGLTSAVQDAHNICWKLAAVLAGHAGPGLLDTYEAERKPVAARNVSRSLANVQNFIHMIKSIGAVPGGDRDSNWQQYMRIISDRPEDREHQRQLTRVFASQSMEFHQHNVDHNFDYRSRAVIDDGSPEPESIDAIRVYEPSTRPGRPLPHAWLMDYDGNLVSTLDLVRPGRFLLIAGENGQPWCDALADILAATDGPDASEPASVPIDVVRIGHLDGDYLDSRLHWLRRREISAGGAILVRPDRCVAWRQASAAEQPAQVLRQALTQVLAAA